MSTLFLHTLASDDSILSQSLKSISSNGSELTVVALSASAPLEGVPVAPNTFDAVYSVLALTGDALSAVLSRVITVLRPGGRYTHGLQVRVACLCVLPSLCVGQVSGGGDASLALMVAGFTNLEVAKDAPAAEVHTQA